MNRRRRREEGQILVLSAGMLLVLLGLSALAVDVGWYLSTLRLERSVADAAALAGAQDEYDYVSGTKVVGAAEHRKARTSAMRSAVAQLTGVANVEEVALPTCGGVAPPYSSNLANCPVPGTSYYVSVSVPARTCVELGGCDPLRSVQVTIRNPRHPVAFATIFGVSGWNASQTSIAERHLGAAHTFVTLRPPKPRVGPSCTPVCDDNADNIRLDGTGTTLRVAGDIGTNTNMTLAAGASVVLTDSAGAPDPERFVYRYDAYKGWTGDPPDKQMSSPIKDPNYPIPTVRTGAPIFDSSGSAANATKLGELSAADCATEVTTKVPAGYGLNAADTATRAIVCYKPGVYGKTFTNIESVLRTIVLTPGVYFLDGGMNVPSGKNVFGGYEAGAPGVALVLPRSGNTFAANGADRLALNAGDAFPSGTGTGATAAEGWDGALVQTTGATPIPMTLLVQKDEFCVVQPTYPTACREAQNNTLRLPGGGSAFVFGVQYAPTDNVQISGGSGADGYLGQVWAWTVKYSGGTSVQLLSSAGDAPGLLRLATPCSPQTPCANPESTAPVP